MKRAGTGRRDAFGPACVRSWGTYFYTAPLRIPVWQEGRGTRRWIFEIRSRPFVVLSAGFVIVSLLVVGGVTSALDRSVSTAFHGIGGHVALDLAMWAITEAGDLYYMLVFAIVMLVIRRTRRVGLSLMICLVLATLATGYLKCGIGEESPQLEFAGSDFPIPSSRDTFSLFCQTGYGSSFPSGHAARAAVFGVILGYVLSERFPRGCYLLLLYPVMMSISRVYVLQHFPMDVVGGTILGVLIAGAVGYRSKLHLLFQPSQS